MPACSERALLKRATTAFRKATTHNWEDPSIVLPKEFLAETQTSQSQRGESPKEATAAIAESAHVDVGIADSRGELAS